MTDPTEKWVNTRMEHLRTDDSNERVQVGFWRVKEIEGDGVTLWRENNEASFQPGDTLMWAEDYGVQTLDSL